MFFYFIFIESHPYQFGRHPSYNSIRRYILCDYTSGSYNSSIANMYPCHHNRISTYPTITTDNGFLTRFSPRKNDRNSYLIETMVTTDNMYIIRYHSIFAYAHTRINAQTRSYIRILPSFEILCNRAPRSSNKRGMNLFQSIFPDIVTPFKQTQ